MCNLGVGGSSPIRGENFEENYVHPIMVVTNHFVINTNLIIARIPNILGIFNHPVNVLEGEDKFIGWRRITQCN